MKTEVEVGVTLSQAKKLLEPTEARKRQGQNLPWSLWRESVPASTWITDFWPLNLREFICAVCVCVCVVFKLLSLWEFVTEAQGNEHWDSAGGIFALS